MAAHQFCFFFKKKKKRKRRDFFLPLQKHKAWEERGKADAETLKLGVWPAFTLIPEHQAFALSHHRGLRDCPSRTTLHKKETLGLALVIHLPSQQGRLGPRESEGLYPESQSRAEQSRHRMKPSRT